MAETISISVPNDDGILFKLPREVRDKIYRYLVKGTYVIAVPPSQTSTANFYAASDLGFSVHGPDLGILRVSKALSHETIELLFAESIFESWLSFVKDGPYIQYAKEASDRMMIIKYHII